MNDSFTKFDNIVIKIATIASTTPPDLVCTILSRLMAWDNQNWALSRAKALANIQNPQLRADFLNLFDLWEKECPDLPGSSVALAIRSSLTTRIQSQNVQLDLVWTGPESQAIPFRRTDQALLQLINGSKRSLLVVSFAVYKIKPIIKALEKVLKRNVELKIVLEDPEESEGKLSYASEYAFGNNILAASELYVWPLAKRPLSEDGKHGSLHAKVAVADSEVLFVSSANLTEYAMNLNMEMGVFIQGGELPGQVSKHFEEMITLGYLKKVEIYGK